MNSNNKIEKFTSISGNHLLILVCLGLTALLLYLYKATNDIEEGIAKAHYERENSIRLADELRQSSDDLTNLARIYAVTADSNFFNYFKQVLAIREGEAARPVDYDKVYWDLFIADGFAPRPENEKISLVELIAQYNNEDDLLAYFKNAKQSSDELVKVEEEAFNALKGIYKDSLGNYTIHSTPNQELAISLLFSEEYLNAKKKIMLSINDFQHYIHIATLDRINKLEDKQRLFSIIFKLTLFVIAFLILLFGADSIYSIFKSKNSIKHIGEGNGIWKKLFKEIVRSWRLLVIGAIFSLLVVIFFQITKNVFQNNLKYSTQQSLQTVLETTTDNLLNWFQDIEAELELISENEDFIKWVVDTSELKQNVIISNTKNEFRKYFSDKSYSNFLITDLNGSILLSDNILWKNTTINEIDPSLDLIEISRFRGVFNKFPSTQSPDSSYNHKIKFGIPLYSKEDNLGVLIVFIDPQERFTKVLQGGRLGESGESYAFNAMGEMISESRFTNQLHELGYLPEGKLSELNINIKVPAKFNNGREVYTEMAKNALSGHSGINIEGYKDYRGVPVIGAWTWLEPYRIGVSTEIDYSEAFKIIILYNRISIYSIGFFIVILLSLIAIFISIRARLALLNQQIEDKSALTQSIIDSMPDLLFYKDKQLKYLGANKAFTKYLGLAENQIIGLLDSTIISEKIGHKFDSSDKDVIKNETPVSLEWEDVDSNGNSIIFDTRKTPFYNDKGELMGLIGISRDITQRKSAEEKIRNSEIRHRSVTDTAREAIISVNDKGIIHSWNKAAEFIFGYNEKEAIGSMLDIIIPEKYWEEHSSGLKRFRQKGGFTKLENQTIEFHGKRKNGTIFPIELSLAKWESAGAMNITGIIRDITDRKEAEEVIKRNNTRMKNELNAARKIQMSMIPKEFPVFNSKSKYDIHANMIPAREVGGDFYDFYELDDDNLFICICDVSGKGAGAALFMALAKSTMRLKSEKFTSPAQILTKLNDELASNNEMYMFITVFAATLNLKTGLLTYCNAGHNPPLIKFLNGEIKILKDLHGPVIGAVEGLNYREDSIQLSAGDLILLYTDGISDATNENKERYTDKRIYDQVRSLAVMSPENIIKSIISETIKHTGKAEQFDDITILSARYWGQQKGKKID